MKPSEHPFCHSCSNFNRLEAAAPDDGEESKVKSYVEMLEGWKGLFEDSDREISESVRKDCERLVEQIRSGEVDHTESAFIDHIPSKAMDLFVKNVKRIYGDDF
jgi:hypothetical protein